MSEERQVLEVKTSIGPSNVVGGTAIPIRSANETGPSIISQDTKQPDGITQPTKEQEAEIESRANRKARLASILDRSVLGDRFNVKLPDDKHGEWIRNDPMEIHRMEALGFKVDTEYATNRALHGDGSDSAIVGDVIFMTCERETKDIIDEIRQEQFFAKNAKPGEKKMLGEEMAFAGGVAAETHGIIPTEISSSVTRPSVTDIREAVLAADRQTNPS